MHIHILGIAGTFMANIALLAKNLGFFVTGQDQNIYPPMSNQLAAANIIYTNGYEPEHLPVKPDLIVIGNVMRRGMPIIEHILAQKLPFMSGPEFLAKFILLNQHVLVVTGTHGKTTTTSMLAWILHYAGLNPGFLIGGVPKNFNFSSAVGAGKFFVVEGDEYDCAFFDKRSKFIHYRPTTLIINNIEFDHADIFADIQAIIMQFHYLLRIIPGPGLVIFNELDQNINNLLSLGCWTKKQGFSLINNKLNNLINNLSNNLKIPGQHNLTNSLAASLAALNIGIEQDTIIAAINQFKGVVKRLEHKGSYKGIDIYDDFAHHPTAIEASVNALYQQHPGRNIIAIVDIGSNTMKLGTNVTELPVALQKAHQLYFYADLNKITWDVENVFNKINKPGKICNNINDLITTLINNISPGDQVLFMSNVNLATASDQLVIAIAANN